MTVIRNVRLRHIYIQQFTYKTTKIELSNELFGFISFVFFMDLIKVANIPVRMATTRLPNIVVYKFVYSSSIVVFFKSPTIKILFGKELTYHIEFSAFIFFLNWLN